MGAALDEATRQIISQTVEGLAAIRGLVIQEFGDVQVIGKGVCKNGPFPGEAQPDFVALSPNQNQPILIEVKNSTNPIKSDHFQATFYNTVARETGVVVHEQRFEKERLNLVPVAYHDSIAVTMLVYPRASRFERISEKVSLGDDALEEMWRAKQLGYMGKSPHMETS